METMQMKFIERDTVLFIYEEIEGQSFDNVYEAKFYDIKDETTFFAQSTELYNAFQSLGKNANLRISFLRGANMYAFSGKARDVTIIGGARLMLIEQMTGLEATSRRKYDREEMKVDVQIFGLTEENLNSSNFKKANEIVEFVGETFDISAGGLCVVANRRLESAYEPYFLVEFTLNRKDKFLLPAKLVRKGNCPQTMLYRCDFGFQFVYDNIPHEKERLTTALFSAKLSLFN